MKTANVKNVVEVNKCIPVEIAPGQRTAPDTNPLHHRIFKLGERVCFFRSDSIKSAKKAYNGVVIGVHPENRFYTVDVGYYKTAVLTNEIHRGWCKFATGYTEFKDKEKFMTDEEIRVVLSKPKETQWTDEDYDCSAVFNERAQKLHGPIPSNIEDLSSEQIVELEKLAEECSNDDLSTLNI